MPDRCDRLIGERRAIGWTEDRACVVAKDFRAAIERLRRHSDVVVERLQVVGDFAQECTRRHSVYASDEFTRNKAHRHGMIRRHSARGPPRGLGSDGGSHRIPVIQRIGSKPARDPGHSRTVLEHMAHAHGFFAALREFRPIARDRCIEIDASAIGEHVNQQCRHRFDDRHHADERICSPRLSARAVAPTAPEVDGEPPVLPYRNCGAVLIATREVIGEGFAYARVAAVASPREWNGHCLIPAGVRRCQPVTRW